MEFLDAPSGCPSLATPFVQGGNLLQNNSACVLVFSDLVSRFAISWFFPDLYTQIFGFHQLGSCARSSYNVVSFVAHLKLLYLSTDHFTSLHSRVLFQCTGKTKFCQKYWRAINLTCDESSVLRPALTSCSMIFPLLSCSKKLRRLCATISPTSLIEVRAARSA